MSIIMLTVIKNFESVVLILLYGGSLLLFNQAPQVEKECGAEEQEEMEVLKNQ